MKNDLDLVITALEAEKRSLQKMMKQAISEYDYLIAYHHSEALSQLDNHLRVLHCFKDPLYNEKEELKRREKFFRKKSADSELLEMFRDSYLREIQDRKQKIIDKKTGKFTFNDSQQIDDLIFNLYEGKISSFQIILTLYDELEINFSKEANALLITIDLYEPHEQDFVFDNRLSNPLKGLGFEYDESRSNYIYKYDLSNFKDAQDIKIFLSRLFFDVFQIYDVKQSIIIKYEK